MTRRTSSSTRPKLPNPHLNQRRRDGLVNESIEFQHSLLTVDGGAFRPIDLAARVILELEYNNGMKRSIAADNFSAPIASKYYLQATMRNEC